MAAARQWGVESRSRADGAGPFGKLSSVTILRSTRRARLCRRSEAMFSLSERQKLTHYCITIRTKLHSVSTDKEALNLTFVIKDRGPLTVWFHSLFDLEQAYAEWEREAKKSGAEPEK